MAFTVFEFMQWISGKPKGAIAGIRLNWANISRLFRWQRWLKLLSFVYSIFKLVFPFSVWKIGKLRFCGPSGTQSTRCRQGRIDFWKVLAFWQTCYRSSWNWGREASENCTFGQDTFNGKENSEKLCGFVLLSWGISAIIKATERPFEPPAIKAVPWAF